MVLDSVQDVMYYDIALCIVGAQAEDVYVLVLLSPNPLCNLCHFTSQRDVFNDAI